MNKQSEILTYFRTMKDHRLDQKKKHDMLDIITITIAAVLCGADDWYEIEEFAEIRESWLKTFLTLENGIPVLYFQQKRECRLFSEKYTSPLGNREQITLDDRCGLQ